MAGIGEYVLVLSMFILSFSMAVYGVMVVYSSLFGSFYVSTKQKEVDKIVNAADFKKGEYVLELGSGDGKFLISAARHKGVVGKGVEINPLLVEWSKIKSKIQHLTSVTFEVGNINSTNVSTADVIYVFLMPQHIERIADRLASEPKKGTRIISHAFDIDALKKYKYKTIQGKPFPTYFYRISS